MINQPKDNLPNEMGYHGGNPQAPSSKKTLLLYYKFENPLREKRGLDLIEGFTNKWASVSLISLPQIVKNELWKLFTKFVVKLQWKSSKRIQIPFKKKSFKLLNPRETHTRRRSPSLGLQPRKKWLKQLKVNSQKILLASSEFFFKIELGFLLKQKNWSLWNLICLGERRGFDQSNKC